MAKILDLDAIAPPPRYLKIKGQEHEMKVLSVSDYIRLARDADALQKRIAKGDATNSDVMEANLANIKELVPTFPDELLQTLDPARMLAIMVFARETASEDAPALAAEKVEAGKA